MSGRPTTLAVGGKRQVPVPDPVARDYLLLCLRLDQHVPGFVDAYLGPADLKAQVDLEQLRPPAGLLDDALALRDRVASSEVDDAGRRRWLTAQLTAIATHARALAGDPLPYPDHVAACFDQRMERRPDATYRAAAARLDALVPADGALRGRPVAERLAAWDERFFVPIDRLEAVIDRMAAVARERSSALFGLPAGESLRFGLVRNQPWGAYNWYEGGLRSRIDVNTDLRAPVARLLRTIAHETYPGHHLEHAWHEADLVGRQGHVEASVLTINTPECLLSEGLGEIGYRFAVPTGSAVDLLVELYGAAGLAVAEDRAAARDAAERTVAMAPDREALGFADSDAALLRHAEGMAHGDVLAYLCDVGLVAPDRAAKRLEFIEHPLWRTYVFVYSEGQDLLGRWLDAAPAGEQAARFGRLLHEELTPGAIRAEIAGPGLGRPSAGSVG